MPGVADVPLVTVFADAIAVSSAAEWLASLRADADNSGSPRRPGRVPSAGYDPIHGGPTGQRSRPSAAGRRGATGQRGATPIPKDTFRIVTRGADGQIRIRDYESQDALLKRHTQVGVDDCSTDLELRGLPVFRGLIGPIPEGTPVIRYEAPEVFAPSLLEGFE